MITEFKLSPTNDSIPIMDTIMIWFEIYLHNHWSLLVSDMITLVSDKHLLVAILRYVSCRALHYVSLTHNATNLQGVQKISAEKKNANLNLNEVYNNAD